MSNDLSEADRELALRLWHQKNRGKAATEPRVTQINPISCVATMSDRSTRGFPLGVLSSMRIGMPESDIQVLWNEYREQMSLGIVKAKTAYAPMVVTRVTPGHVIVGPGMVGREMISLDREQHDADTMRIEKLLAENAKLSERNAAMQKTIDLQAEGIRSMWDDLRELKKQLLDSKPAAAPKVEPEPDGTYAAGILPRTMRQPWRW